LASRLFKVKNTYNAASRRGKEKKRPYRNDVLGAAGSAQPIR